MKIKTKSRSWGAALWTTRQNIILVYCWTTLFHTYIKEAKKKEKINSNFIEKKKEKNWLSLVLPSRTDYELWYS